MNKLLLALPIFATALVLTMPVAHAFTFEDQSTNTNTNAIDLEDQVKGFASGTTTTQQGPSGFHFSVGPSSGTGLTNRFDSPPAWVGNPLYLDKGSSRDQ